MINQPTNTIRKKERQQMQRQAEKETDKGVQKRPIQKKKKVLGLQNMIWIFVKI